MADPTQPQQPLDQLTGQPQTLTPRMKALQNLSNQLPVANSSVAQGQQAAQDMQLQQAVQKSAPTANTTETAQQTGAAAAQSQLVNNASNQVKEQGQLGQVALGEQKTQQQAALGGQQAAATQSQMNNVQRLASVSEKAKQELYDDQMSFQKDEAGRTLFNSTQLDDYARIKARSDEELRNYQQTATQLSNRKIQAMEQAQKLVNLDLEHKMDIARQQGNQQAIVDAQKIQNDMQAQISREKSRAANKAGAITAVTTIAGTVAGGVFGGAPGAAAGGAGGKAVGTLFSSTT